MKVLNLPIGRVLIELPSIGEMGRAVFCIDYFDIYRHFFFKFLFIYMHMEKRKGLHISGKPSLLNFGRGSTNLWHNLDVETVYLACTLQFILFLLFLL